MSPYDYVMAICAAGGAVYLAIGIRHALAGLRSDRAIARGIRALRPTPAPTRRSEIFESDLERARRER